MNKCSVRESSAAWTVPLAPTVTVVIPAYNAAEYLAEALESVLTQTYQPLEIIVVDDGSEDDTPQVVADWAGKVTCMRKERGGPASARNVGVRAAKGEWIAFLDADDMWMPRLLENLVKGGVETAADLIFCDYLKLINGKGIGPTHHEYTGLKVCLDARAPNGVLLNPFELLFKVGNYIPASGVLVNRESLLKVGLFDERGNLYSLWSKRE